jgi:hypothetical protein
MNQPPTADPPPRRQDFLTPSRIVAFLLWPRLRYVAAWLIALGATIIGVSYAWNDYNNPERGDGNGAHCTIDFGGQWLTWRMLVRGYADHLYDRNYLRTALMEGYRHEFESPTQEVSDAERLMGWLMGYDDPEAAKTVASFLTPLASRDNMEAAVFFAAGNNEWTDERLAAIVAPHRGGALYPPIHVFTFAPLGLLPPHQAYRVMQIINTCLIFLIGFAGSRMTRGRVWCPVAITLVIVFPGFAGAIVLGQNSLLSLALLCLGWWQITRDRPILGGVFWGLLAFKPVWAASFFLVPLLTRRWRFCAAMLVTGTVLAVATLPLVGWHSWIDWLHVGRDAAADYDRDEWWIFLSRDLLGVPRRWLMDFSADNEEGRNPHGALPKQIGLGVLAGIVLVTAALALLRRRQATALEGPPAACLLLGAWLSCFHFMYYDTELALLPVCLLLADWRRYLRLTFVEITLFRPLDEKSYPEWSDYYRPQPEVPTPPMGLLKRVPWLERGQRSLWVVNRAVPTLVLLLIALPPLMEWIYLEWVHKPHHQPPFDTFCLLALWAWCVWTWARTPEAKIEGEGVLSTEY